MKNLVKRKYGLAIIVVILLLVATGCSSDEDTWKTDKSIPLMGLEEYFPDNTEIISYEEEGIIFPWNKGKSTSIQIGKEKLCLTQTPLLNKMKPFAILRPNNFLEFQYNYMKEIKTTSFGRYNNVKDKSTEMLGHKAYIIYLHYDNNPKYLITVALFRKGLYTYALADSPYYDRKNKKMVTTGHDAFWEIVKNMQQE